MNFEEFRSNVERWAAERGIYEHSTIQAQVLKAASEMGELADATIKGDLPAFTDAVGDVIVCLVNAAYMRGVDFDECLLKAWKAIEHRQGRMVEGGAFVKDES